VKFILRDLFKRFEVVDTGVVNQDVDLPERFLGSGKEAFNIRFLCDVALNRDRFSAAFGDFIDNFVRIVFEDA